MEERLKIKELIARLYAKDGLDRPKVDKVPVSPEEEYVLDQIQAEHKLPTRASVWRWLLAKYFDFQLAEQMVKATKAKAEAEATLLGLVEQRW